MWRDLTKNSISVCEKRNPFANFPEQFIQENGRKLQGQPSIFQLHFLVDWDTNLMEFQTTSMSQDIFPSSLVNIAPQIFNLLTTKIQ